MLYPSPLRYPGGKKKLSTYVEKIVVDNDIQGGTYIEPFAGGANIALCLLLNDIVNSIIINDLDRSIYAFWYSVLHQPDELCALINNTSVNMDSWYRQRNIQNHKEDYGFLELGFSTFFLNRTNRSGIIRGGVIGGKNQTGAWKMDVRFNKEDLIRRIQGIARYADKIMLHNEDAIAFINNIQDQIDEHSLVYFDPPYYNQGAALYSNYYTHDDHANLARFIQQLDCKWMLTYDYTEEIIEMYRESERHVLSLSYTAQEKTRGREMIAFSPRLVIPMGQFSSIAVS